MKVYRISAVTLKVRDMEESCKFFSRLPGFRLTFGGAESDSFSTFEVGHGSNVYLNLELRNDNVSGDHNRRTDAKPERQDFGRLIFHTEDADGLYRYMKNDEYISKAVVFETKPTDASWGERFFHVREPNGYQLSFAQPLSEERKLYCE
jgi:catechol 2,3-dioxygenase-like lactoylglutathione lyase family enzyme